MNRIETSRHAALWSAHDLDERMAQAMGARAEAFRAYRRAWHAGITARAFPLQIDVALNESCNLRCPMCTYSDGLSNKGKESWMTLEHWQALLADAVPRGLCAVGFNGINEPLIRPDLWEFVRAAREAGVLDVMLHTNGTRLGGPQVSALVHPDRGLTRIFVSLDAATNETYQQMRPGAGDLETTEAQIRGLLYARAGRPLPVLGVCFVRTQINAHELEAFREKWTRGWPPYGGADFLSIQEYMNPWPDKSEKDALAVADRRPPTAFRCQQPFQRLRIGPAPQHTIHPCCSFPGDKMSAGTTRDTSLQQAWDGPLLTRLRRMHAAGRWAEHPVCAECVRHSFVQDVGP